MPIPQSQLNTWANQGGTTGSAAAYASIRNALLKPTSSVSGLGLNIFLQGSYANATNIYGDSDIDVVVLYPTTFYKDMSALTLAQQQLHETLFPPATYNWSDLRNDVLDALRSHYGTAAVTPGKKCIKVVTANGRKPSDVVPAMEFRRYATFADRNNLTAHWGIHFFDSSNNTIANYPKYHIERGEDKNQAGRTAGQYKATIRILKNFRNYLIGQGSLAGGVAPSYCIECALHNVPDHLFVGPYATTIPAILHYLMVTPYAGFMSQNGVIPLIGNGPTQWPASDFVTFVNSAETGWNSWR